MKHNPKDAGHCPCGRPAIGLRTNVPCCARCWQWEENWEGTILNGERQTAFGYAFAKYKRAFHWHSPEFYTKESDLTTGTFSSFNH